MKRLRYITLALVAMLAACSNVDDDGAGPILPMERAGDQKRLAKLGADQLYNRARRALESGSYPNALDLFARIETRYPFSDHARQAQLETAYVFYRMLNHESAIAAAERFISQYPRHKNIDYAHYLKGIANFARATDDIGSWLQIDGSERDPGYTREAFYTFSRLINQYPQSRYAADARQRMVFLRQRLAQHEMHIADFYVRREAWLAAIARAKHVVENYQGTAESGKALQLMATLYRKIGMDDLAANAERIYQRTFVGGNTATELPIQAPSNTPVAAPPGA